MAKRKKKVVSSSYKSKSDDRLLMVLAASAAIIVGFFAIFSYKSQSMMALPTQTPSQIISVNLDTQNNSGEYGSATLQEVDGKTVVTVNMYGFAKGIVQPAHIHVGSCPNPGAVKYPLTSVLNGKSTTILNVTLAELKSMGNLAINVHKSVASSGLYISCGNL